MPKSKLTAFLSLFLIFFSGAALGAFAYRLYAVNSVQPINAGGGPPRKMSPEEFRKHYAADLAKDVKLDDQQVAKLNTILDQTTQEWTELREKMKPEHDALEQKQKALNEKWKPERDAIHDKQVEQINAMLREDQRPLYASFRAERDRQRKLRDQMSHKK
jgi:hypothetical protein